MRLIIALVFLGFFTNSARAEYAFPLKDPYYATITAALLKADDRDKNAQYQDLKLSPLPERDNVPFYRSTQNAVTLRYWPATGAQPAPLIFLLAGLGGTSSASYLDYLANLFQKKGFQVLTLPSPTNWNFALAGSASGMPGITRRDAQDLYHVMQLGLGLLREKKIAVKSSGLIGLSLGALDAAYISVLDSQENKIGLERTLLINPPVDIFYALHSIDTLAAEKANLTGDQIQDLKKRATIYGASLLMLKDINDPAYFDGIETKFPTTLTERKFLIGESMKEFLPTLLFTTQQIKDLGIFQNPVATDDPQPRLAEAGAYGFQDYLEKFLLKSMQEKQPGYDLAALQRDSLLLSLRAELQANERVFLMHNEDDPIVNAEQIGQLREVFGERAKIYPSGGHVGNIWFPENRDQILDTFSGFLN